MAKRRRVAPFDVKALRERHGLSQSALARLIWNDPKITHESERARMISRWENGHHQPNAMCRSYLERLDRELGKQKSDGQSESKADGPTRRPLTSASERERDSTNDAADRPAPGRSGGLLPSVS